MRNVKSFLMCVCLLYVCPLMAASSNLTTVKLRHPELRPLFSHGYIYTIEKIETETRIGGLLHVYEGDGTPIVDIPWLDLLPEYNYCSLRGEAIRPDRIVMAFTLGDKKKMERPFKISYMIMILNFKGQLLHSIRLAEDAESTIDLDIAEDGSIWTLASGQPDKKPEENPLFLHFSADGKQKEVVASRALLPDLPMSGKVGHGSLINSFGVTKTKLYYWAPELDEMITLDFQQRKIIRKKAQLPTKRDDSGNVSSPVVYRAMMNNKGETLYGVFYYPGVLSGNYLASFTSDKALFMERQGKLTGDLLPGREQLLQSLLASVDEDRFIFVSLPFQPISGLAAPFNLLYDDFSLAESGQ